MQKCLGLVGWTLAQYVFSCSQFFATIPKACGFEAATLCVTGILPAVGGSLIPIVVCGEAVPALRPAGFLPAAKNKGKMPSPHGDGFYLTKHKLAHRFRLQRRRIENQHLERIQFERAHFACRQLNRFAAGVFFPRAFQRIFLCRTFGQF